MRGVAGQFIEPRLPREARLFSGGRGDRRIEIAPLDQVDNAFQSRFQCAAIFLLGFEQRRAHGAKTGVRAMLLLRGRKHTSGFVEFLLRDQRCGFGGCFADSGCPGGLPASSSCHVLNDGSSANSSRA